MGILDLLKTNSHFIYLATSCKSILHFSGCVACFFLCKFSWNFLIQSTIHCSVPSKQLFFFLQPERVWLLFLSLKKKIILAILFLNTWHPHLGSYSARHSKLHIQPCNLKSVRNDAAVPPFLSSSIKPMSFKCNHSFPEHRTLQMSDCLAVMLFFT